MYLAARCNGVRPIQSLVCGDTFGNKSSKIGNWPARAANGQQELSGYGFGHLPTVPGCHDVEIATWRPLGGEHDEINSFFLGGSDRLKKDSYV